MAAFEIFTDADSGDEVGEDVEIEEYFEEFFLEAANKDDVVSVLRIYSTFIL